MPTTDDDRTNASSGHGRCLYLPVSYNVRDLGGYPTRDGGRTRWHRLLRAGNLDRLTVRSQHALLSAGLTTVVDLRDLSEVRRYPDVFARNAAVRYLNLPMVPIDSDVWKAELNRRYLLLVRRHRTEIRRIITAIAMESQTLIVHCTAGKDRTGLIVALILAALDVPLEVIAADYALSESCLAPFFAAVRKELQVRQADLARFDRDAKAAPDTILRVLDYIHRWYGGVGQYLALPHRVDMRLRQMLVA